MPPIPPVPYLPHHRGPRLVLYAQTYHTNESYTSLLPLLPPTTGLTHLILAAIHLNSDPNAITLNDHHPSDPRFTTLWSEVSWLRASGVKILGMLGGAAKGSYARLSGPEADFERYYLPLKKIIEERQLDGLDLDVEEETSLATISRLIRRLRSDFGAKFIITMAPVATALIPDPRITAPAPPRPVLAGERCPNALHPSLPHLSGFSYAELECSDVGKEVDWYNVQFYCGWGDAGSTQWYDAIISAGWKPERVVLGVVTHPGHGKGFVPVQQLTSVCNSLRQRYPDTSEEGGEEEEGNGEVRRRGFGGVMGWEYHNTGDCEGDIMYIMEGELECDTLLAGWCTTLARVLRTKGVKGGKGGKKDLGITPEQIRQMLGQGAVASGGGQGQQNQGQKEEKVWPEEKIEALVVIGFAREEAISALNATDGNVDLAAGFLFDHR